MSKKLVKHGNSYALIIDKALLKMLDITPDTDLKLTIKDDSLMVKPIDKEVNNKRGGGKKKRNRDQDFEEIADRVIDKYADLLRKLSKT